MDATQRRNKLETLFDDLITEVHSQVKTGGADAQTMKFAYQLCKDFKVGADSTKSKTLSKLGSSLPSNVIDANIRKARG